MPGLTIHTGERGGQRWTIQADSITVGRGSECDLVLNERQVSRQHICIKRQGDLYYIADLDSKNGTWVNDQELKGERPLRDGDKIDLAHAVLLTFLESDATAPMSAHALTIGSSRLRLDREARRVFLAGKEVEPPLSLPQYRLLELLVDAQGAVCSRADVIQAVWPEAVSEGVSEQAIDALVRRLRDRLAEVDPEGQYVITVRGHGFRLDVG
ncbi:MAG TPA: FHA domain-containing protein [Aggregatilineaceae bacterium]|nr:FHA domain-containing protein [Aggregatilineaceae bacterium]